MTALATVDLLDGLAQLLDGAGIGRYLTTGTYQPTDVGIVFGAFSEQPDQQIALTVYSVADDPVMNESTIAVQVMLRGGIDPRAVWNRSAQTFDLLQGLQMRWFGSVYVALMWRQSGRLDGRDENNRWLSSENYYARCNWPTSNRTE